ncbi:MAG: hypothetical protein H7175_21880 [Burkholderiales bacterium]|nr:hypothetical protein [Anaerolineae bacterium]
MPELLTTTDLQQPIAVTANYMLLPIEAGFNWGDCFAPVSVGQWYLVVFRCKHRADADEELLTQMDVAAFAAASSVSGFLHYFAGVPCATGECLSFCLWDNATSARAGGAHPDHRKAMEIGVRHYEYYRLERYAIHKNSEALTFAAL